MADVELRESLKKLENVDYIHVSDNILFEKAKSVSGYSMVIDNGVITLEKRDNTNTIYEDTNNANLALTTTGQELFRITIPEALTAGKDFFKILLSIDNDANKSGYLWLDIKKADDSPVKTVSQKIDKLDSNRLISVVTELENSYSADTEFVIYARMQGGSLRIRGDVVLSKLQVEVVPITLSDRYINLTKGHYQYDDIILASFARKTFVSAGRVDYDWDKLCIKMQNNGSNTNPSDHVSGTDHIGHKFVESKNESDLIPIDIHFHWLQFNNTDQYEFELKWRIINNGKSYSDSDWNTEIIKTCNGNDELPFVLESGKDYTEQITTICTPNVYIKRSSQMQVKFARIDSNSFTNDFLLVQLDSHIPINKLGTDTIY